MVLLRSVDAHGEAQAAQLIVVDGQDASAGGRRLVGFVRKVDHGGAGDQLKVRGRGYRFAIPRTEG